MSIITGFGAVCNRAAASGISGFYGAAIIQTEPNHDSINRAVLRTFGLSEHWAARRFFALFLRYFLIRYFLMYFGWMRFSKQKTSSHFS